MSDGLLVRSVEALERVVDTAPDAATAVRDALALLRDGCGAGVGLGAPLAERLVAALAQHVFGAGVYDVLLREERAALVVAPLQRTAGTAAPALLAGALAGLARPALRADALVPGLVACVRCAFLTAAPGTPAEDPGIVQCFRSILSTRAQESPSEGVEGEDEDNEWHTVLALLCTFFQRASNAVPTLDDCTPAAFVPHLLGPLCAHVVTRPPSSSPAAAASKMLAEALTKACNLGQRDAAVVPLLLRHAGTAAVVADAVAAAPPHVRADVLAALARADTTADTGALVACARACLAADRAGTEAVLATRLCTVRPVHAPAQVARYAAALDTLGLARPATATTARAWAELAYATCVAPETHADVTRLLCCLVRRADRDALHAWGVVAPLLEGINAHLAASAGRVHRFGMAVATVFSRVIDPAHALCFDGIDDAFIFGDGCEERDAAQSTGDENTKPHRKKHRTVDLDEVIDLNGEDEDDAEQEEEASKEDENEEEDDNDEEEGDDGLRAYDLEDDYSDMELDDDHPSFIGQCLDAIFDAKDDGAKVREALVTLAGLTDRPAHETGLGDHAARVLDTLLFYHNSAGVDDFDVLKHHILLRTTVCCPALCARVLCRAFYEENHALADRTEILFLLREAAATLATLDHARTAEAHAALTATAAASLLPRAPRVELLPLNSTAELPAPALGLTESSTRRWHSIRDASDPAHQPVRNCFLEHADAFFYPLISNVDKPLFVFSVIFLNSLCAMT